MTVVRYVRAFHQATLWLYDPENFNEAIRLLAP